MPGVYRDPSDGTFRYYIINDYEDRRRRDLDDQRAGRLPGRSRGPTFRPPPIPIRPAPVVPNAVAQPASAQPPAFDFDAFARAVNDRYRPPDASGLLAVLNGGDGADDDPNAWFDRLLGSLPTRHGQNPAFDALVDDPDTTVLTAQELLDRMGWS